jgi:hypothetical protein
VHAVAGLLKMWLRELPTEVLTVELHDDFLGVIGKYFRFDLYTQVSTSFNLSFSQPPYLNPYNL